MSHRVAGIDVHKKMLAVVVVEAAAEQAEPERRKFGTGAGELLVLADWLNELGAEEAVMESTAQYWKPVWRALEGGCHLELAQAQSNRGPHGRKSDFADAERLVRRYLAEELILSFVPDTDPEFDETRIPGQSGLWGSVLAVSGVAFHGILALLGVRGSLDLEHPLWIINLDYPGFPSYAVTFAKVRRGCAVCDESKIAELAIED